MNLVPFLSKDNVSKAKERIILASLYLGTGTKEQQLVSINFIFLFYFFITNLWHTKAEAKG